MSAFHHFYHVGGFAWKLIGCVLATDSVNSATYPVPLLQGDQEGRAPPTTACAPHFGLLKILFGASGNNKALDNNFLGLSPKKL